MDKNSMEQSKKEFFAIQTFTLRQAIELIRRKRQKGIHLLVTTYSLKAFLDKLSISERVEWDLFCRKKEL